MKKLLFTRNKRIILKAMLVFVGLILLSGNVFAQAYLPKLPLLSLGVNVPDGNREWYPDNRIWVVPSPSVNTDTTEIMVPIFIENRWLTHKDYKSLFTTEPISSFAFRLYYNGEALEFVDLQKKNPFSNEEAENNPNMSKFSDAAGNYVEPLASSFNLSASDAAVTDYGRYFDSNNKPATGGRAVKITGTTFNDNALDSTREYEKKVLMYVRFKVLARGTTDPNKISSYLYFDPTFIVYNGTNIATESPINLFSRYDINNTQVLAAIGHFQTRSNNFKYWNEDLYDQTRDGSRSSIVNKLVGLSLENNIDLYETATETIDTYLPGSILLKVLPALPEFYFDVQNTASTKPDNQIYLKTDANDYSTWILTEPITTDNPIAIPVDGEEAQWGKRYIDVNLAANGTKTPGYLMNDIIIESDQAWLKWATVDLDGYKAPIDESYPVRRGYINYINQIVGQTSENSFSKAANYSADEKVRLAIICDPKEISQDSLKPGTYTGYITLKSADDKLRPTRIQVTFVYFANPVEHNSKITSTMKPATPFTNGIHLKLTPFNGIDTAHTVNLIMGTGSRAGDYVDTLYGEYPQPNDFGKDRYGNNVSFDARFLLDSTVYSAPDKTKEPELYEQWDKLTRYGFGDFSQSDANPRSHSRDIRANKNDSASHVYKVAFKWHNVSQDFFPVILEWDADEFPANTSIYLRNNRNGKDEYTDMKVSGSSIGNNKFTYTFDDRSVKEFYIEYTVGIDSYDNLVNNWDEPMISANGWNFLSLPLIPINPDYHYVFRNSINVPYYFTNSQWQQVPNNILQPGYGYFVKYGNTVDKKFVGSYFYKIDSVVNKVLLRQASSNNPSPLKDIGGWNAIGGVSVRYPIYKSNGDFAIQFDNYVNEYGDKSIADPDYTRNFGVWAYRPNRGYAEVVTALYPGIGYWIKVDEDSYLKLDATPTKQIISIPNVLPSRTAGFDKITIADNAQNMASLYAIGKHVNVATYQLPPAPAAEMFDIRYSDGNYVTNADESIVKLQGVTYPIFVSIENAKSNYTISDVRTGYIYGTVKAGEKGNVLISKQTDALKLTTVTTEDASIFVTVNGNPVVTSNADLTFSIEEAANVNIVLYNSLGEEIANLVNRHFNAGVHNENINLGNISSGNYTIKMVAGDKSSICRINVIK